MRAVFPVFLLAACVSSDQRRRNEYDARYAQAVQLCGHPELSFQTGYNAGYGGQPMDAEWSNLCIEAARSEAVAAYQKGFLQGAQNAPVRVVHTVRSARPTAAAAECTFDSDCGRGDWHCRDHACMGYGDVGDRCVFNEDCANDHCFGGTCRE